MKKRDSTDAGQLNHKPGPVRERYRLSGLLLLGLLHSPLAAVEQCAAGPGAATREVVARYGKSIHFDVYRNDKAVGRHDASFSEENGFLVIRSTLDLGIKLLFIEAYHYRYEATEYWCDNALVRLEAKVNDDGKLSRVTARSEAGQLNDRRREYVDTIRRNGEHLLAIINDILDISTIEAGKMTLEPRAVSPLAVIQQVATLLTPRAREHGIEL